MDQRSSSRTSLVRARTGRPPGADDPASWAATIGDLVVLAGHMPKDREGTVVDGGMEAQMRQTLDNLGRGFLIEIDGLAVRPA